MINFFLNTLFVRYTHLLLKSIFTYLLLFLFPSIDTIIINYFKYHRFILTYERELIAEPEDPNLPVTNSAKSVDITKDLRNYAPFSRATQALQSLRAAAASEPPISEGSNEHTMSSESLPSSKISTNTPADTTQTPGTMPSSPTKVVPMEVSTIFGHGESLCVLNQLKNRMNPEVNLHIYISSFLSCFVYFFIHIYIFLHFNSYLRELQL